MKDGRMDGWMTLKSIAIKVSIHLFHHPDPITRLDQDWSGRRLRKVGRQGILIINNTSPPVCACEVPRDFS